MKMEKPKINNLPREKEALPSEDDERLKKEKLMAEQREQNFEAMQTVIDMFGSDEAREKFLTNIRDYYSAFVAQKVEQSTGVVQESSKQRSILHNKIMDAIRRLSLSQKITPEQEAVLRSFADRERVSSAIKDYLDVEVKYKKHPRMTQIGRMREGDFD